jgi:hypothetical protein
MSPRWRVIVDDGMNIMRAAPQSEAKARELFEGISIDPFESGTAELQRREGARWVTVERRPDVRLAGASAEEGGG